MPFGKHRDEELERIPADYIRWVLENCEDLGPGLQEALEEQLILRRGEGLVRR
jgi:uncharacterized protein (DUF3820 family)